MDRNSIIILVLSLMLILLWPKLMDKVLPPKPMPRTNIVAAATNTISTNQISTSAAPAITAAAATTNAPAPLVKSSEPEQTLALTNKSAVYIFTSYGGGLKLVQLRDYKEAIECARSVPAERRPATLNTAAPAPALALLGGEAIEGDGVYKLTPTDNGVRAEKQLTNGLYITKDFELGSNYLIKTKVRVENRSSTPVGLPQQEIVAGTATPMGPHDNGFAVGVFWSDGKSSEEVKESWFANKTLGCFGGNPRYEYLAGNGNVAWAAVHNQFFTMAAIPNKPAAHISSRRILLPAPSASEIAADSRLVRQPVGYQTSFVYPSSVLKDGQSVEHSFAIYAGPKEYNTLARIGKQYNNNVDAVMGYTGFFGWFAQALLLCLNWLHHIGLHYGLAIVVLTVIIKLVFWPLTNASTKSMKRMQALQPQMKALQEKYKDDPTKMNAKLMEFMKEHKVSPLGGCLPMLLQIPVFFGFYRMLQSAIELRGVPFLWACDLSQADTILYLGGANGFPLNPLPLIMGATMLWQARMTPVTPGVDPTQQKMMKYMPLMFLFIMYNMSAGLTLYWTVQNLLTILQTKITKMGDDPAAAAKTAAGGIPKKKK